MSERETCGRRCEHGGRPSTGPADGAGKPFLIEGAAPHDLPDRPVTVERYALDLGIDLHDGRIWGTATLSLLARRAVSVVTLDAVELDVTAVRFADEPAATLPFDLTGEALVVRLPAPLAADARRALAIEYSARPRRGLHVVKPDKAHPKRPIMAWTQGQDENARAWFPCLDRPRERAATEVAIDVPSPHVALSNGVLVEEGPGRRPGTRCFRWRLDEPHPPYLVTLIVGTFTTLEDRWTAPDGRVVPLRFLTPPARAPLAARTFGPTKDMMGFLSEWTGVPYAWPRYDQVVVEEFTFGGMENTSQTTLTPRTLHDATVADDFSSDPLVVHELAHQWFGDLVTCREWAHAWLNEGFATWCEALWEERARGRDDHDAALLTMREEYLEEASSRYVRPIVQRAYHAPIDIFDRHLYEKGAQVLHHLRGLLGDEDLRRSLRRYLDTHRLGPVETIDLRRAVFEATGRDLTRFLRQWVHTAGHPTITVGLEHDAEAKVCRVIVTQTQAGEPFELDLEVAVVDAAGERTEHRVALRGAKETLSIPLAAAPARVVVDPRGWPCAEITLDLPDAMLRALLAEERDLFTRVRAASALGKLGGRASIEALARALQGDGHFGVLGRVARALGEVGTGEARRALTQALETVTHPRVRKAIAEALGAFVGDPAAGDVLVDMLRKDRTPMIESGAAEALGRTRTGPALAALRAALASRESWNDVVRQGCLRGLGHLFDPAGLDLALPFLGEAHDEATRAAAARAIGALCDSGGPSTRARALEALVPLLADPQLRVRLGAISALASTHDARAVGPLERASTHDLEARVRRAAREGLRSLREANESAGQAGALRRDVDRMREETRTLKDKLERLEALITTRLPAAGPHAGLPGRPERFDPRGAPPAAPVKPAKDKETIRGIEGLQEG